MANAIGDGIITQDTGHLWTWTGTDWKDCGQIAGNPVAVLDEGNILPQRRYMNFVGSGVTATDDSINNRTLVTVSGASGSARQLIAKVVVPNYGSFTDPVTNALITFNEISLTIQFIPSTFSGLSIRFFGAGAGSSIQTLSIHFNNDYDDSNYQGGFYQFYPHSPFVNGGLETGGIFGPAPSNGSNMGNILFDMYGFAAINFFKQYHSVADSGANIIGFDSPPNRQLSMGTWNSLSGINTVNIRYSDGLLNNSTFSIEGLL